MKKTFILALCLLSTMFAAAQKETVEFYDFSYNSAQLNEAEARALRDNLVAEFSAIGRFTVVMQSNKQMVPDPQSSNHYALTGSANTLTVEQKYREISQKYEYVATINYDIRLFDIHTGAAVMTESYSEVGVSYSTIQEARDNAIKNAGQGLKAFVEKAFPIKGEIIAVADGNEKKVKSVYINLGSDAGMDKGQKLVVYMLVDIAGEMTEKEVGKMTVSNVLSGGRSECKVNTGHSAIATALKNGDMLVVKTEASGLDKFNEWLSH